MKPRIFAYLISLAFITLTGSCSGSHDSGAKQHEPVLHHAQEQADSVCTMLRHFYEHYVLQTVPTNQILHRVCTPSMQRFLNRASQRESDDTCSTCLTISPFICDDVESLRFTSDSSCVLTVKSLHQAGWYVVQYNYRGDTLEARIKVIRTPSGHMIDALER